MTDPVLSKVLSETGQAANTRQPLIAALQKSIGRCVVTFFTSFVFPVMIVDDDAQMLEDILRTCNLSEGLSLVLSSPGGDPLAAERIIHVCRVYSDSNFEVIVPRMAKSAATLICFGARKVHMMKTAELGAIDPQVIEVIQGRNRVMPARTIVESYRQLMADALEAPGDKVTPYLQQLERYDYRAIADYDNAMKLSEDIAVRALSTGMMQGECYEEIKKKIMPFSVPPTPYHHGRVITPDDARKCGVAIDHMQLTSDVPASLWELYVRTNYVVSTAVSKIVETADQSFMVARPPLENGGTTG